MTDVDDTDNELAAALRPLWSEAKVAKELSLDAPGLRAAIARGDLLGVPVSGSTELIYPVAQFERSSDSIRVRPGIQVLLRELKASDPWAVGLLIFAIPAPEFSGVTPSDAAARGVLIEDLRNFATRVAAEWH